MHVGDSTDIATTVHSVAAAAAASDVVRTSGNVRKAASDDARRMSTTRPPLSTALLDQRELLRSPTKKLHIITKVRILFVILCLTYNLIYLCYWNIG